VPQFCLLAVFAHPDDETVVGPMLSKYAHEGHRVHLLTLTAGEKGVREHAGIPAGGRLREVRTKELACAVSKLGLTGHTLLNFPDQAFAMGMGPVWNEAAAKVRETIDSLRADVMVTWGPEGGTGHPDHRGVHSVVVQAFQQRSLLKFKPRKLYYAVFPDDGPPEEEWLRGTRVSREFITTRIDCSEYLAAAAQAVECHWSQFSPETMQRVRRTSGILGRDLPLRLAYSSVQGTGRPETGVFEGL